MEKCRRNHEDCPSRLSQTGCRVILHHLFWPKGEYEPGVESEFRELMINRVPMCEYEELQLHRDTAPPPKPTGLLMEHVVEQERLRRELAARPLRRP